ncbi:hypothetical protein ASF61_19475 [Duganella sp. Leaf126]|nr:hypothetical protein ASF61_19475 [Duganella sp. Leaf126]
MVASDDESTAWFDDVPAAPTARARPLQPGHAVAANLASPVNQANPGSPANTANYANHANHANPASPANDANHASSAIPATPASPATPAISDDAIAAMDWPALQEAVSHCTRCPLAATRRHAVNGRGPGQAAWLAIAAAPSALDEAEQRALAGEAGQLLDNMFRAIALKPEADVYVTHLVKCRPPSSDGDDGRQRNPTADELTACRPFLARELALTGATMAMTFGQFAARGLMLGPAARGKVMHYGDAGLPVVATYHPDDLLARPEDKAKAWADLCLARTARD